MLSRFRRLTIDRKSTKKDRKFSLRKSKKDDTPPSDEDEGKEEVPPAPHQLESSDEPPMNFKYRLPEDASDNMKIVYQWFRGQETRDMKMLQDCMVASGDFTVYNKTGGDPLFLTNEIINMIIFNFQSAFPDCDYGWDLIEDDAENPNQVRVKNFRWFGHHTGVPFEFDPYPPIQPKGVFVKDGPVDFLMTIQDGKISVAESWGTNSGPHGTYDKLGGFCVM